MERLGTGQRRDREPTLDIPARSELEKPIAVRYSGADIYPGRDVVAKLALKIEKIHAEL